jgi:outer membrane protein assembly factor BamB
MRLTLAAVLIATAAVATFYVLEQADPGTLRAGPGEGHGAPPGLAAPSGSSWWTPKLLRTLGDPADTKLGKWPGDFDAAPIKAYDFDGDGTKEVVAHNNDTKVYVFSPTTGKVLATFRTTIPPAWHIERILNGVEVGVLKPGDPPSIVIANHAGYISVWQFVPGESSKDAFEFTRQWERRLDDFHKSPGMDSKPALGDLDGDGDLEIVAQTEEKGLYALEHDGKVKWAKDWGGGNSAPILADLDADGKLEAIFASDGGTVSAFDGATGKPKWVFHSAQHANIGPASIPVSPSVGDLDGDGQLEVLWVSRDAHAKTPDVYEQNNMAIFAVKGNPRTGSADIVWMVQPGWAHPLSYTQLIVHDVTGDGKPEVLGMDWNTMGHRPGNWEYLGPSHVFAFDHTGKELWMREVDAWWSNKDIALCDCDGDGQLEVLANGARDGYDGLWRFDAATGKVEGFMAAWPHKVERGPILADLFGKGTMQLLLPVEPSDPIRAKEGGIMLFDLEKPWNAPWPGTMPAPSAKKT